MGEQAELFPALSVQKQAVEEGRAGGNGKSRESEWLSVHLTGLCDLFGPWFSNLKIGKTNNKYPLKLLNKKHI